MLLRDRRAWGLLVASLVVGCGSLGGAADGAGGSVRGVSTDEAVGTLAEEVTVPVQATVPAAADGSGLAPSGESRDPGGAVSGGSAAAGAGTTEESAAASPREVGPASRPEDGAGEDAGATEGLGVEELPGVGALVEEEPDAGETRGAGESAGVEDLDPQNSLGDGKTIETHAAGVPEAGAVSGGAAGGQPAATDGAASGADLEVAPIPGGTEATEAIEAPDRSDSSASPESQAPDGLGPDAEAAPTAASEGAISVPDLEMIDLATGSMVSLRSVVGEGAPLLLWFWDPL